MVKDDEILYTVGQVAHKSGVTVRTLQFYDKCGLLSPGHYSEGGRRLYGWNDLIRLQQILFLKSFGFTLDEIKERIRTEPGKAFGAVLAEQRDVLAGQVKNLQQAISMLDRVIGEIGLSGNVGTKQLVVIIEMMKSGSPYSFMIRYFDNTQIKKLIDVNNTEKPSVQMTPDWQELFDMLVALHRAGVDPHGKEGQAFAGHWWDMVLKSTGGDPELIQTMMDIGNDVDNWPGDVSEFKLAIKEFLAEAFNELFSKKQTGKAKVQA